MKQHSEQEIRIQLAAAYRLIHHFGMAELVYNHLSARVPGTKDHFLINAFGKRYDEITASNLVKIDQQGNPVEGNAKVNPAGFIIHSAIHRARPDAHCIVHTHTLNGMAVASLKEGLIPITQEALRFYQRVAYHDFQGIVLDKGEQESLIHSLGDKNILILRNHGLLTIGASIPQAFCLMYYLERACQVQLTLQATGKEIVIPDKATCEKTAAQHWNKVHQLDDLIWPALIRLLDAKDPSYRE